MKILLLLPLLMSPFALADTLYKCIDEAGMVLYTNQKGAARKCIVLSRDPPVTTVPAPRQAPRSATPGDFPRVDSDTQRGRDGDRRKILGQELATEQLNLEQARKTMAGEVARVGEDPQRHLDRLQGLKDSAALYERNIEALKRELANLR